MLQRYVSLLAYLLSSVRIIGPFRVSKFLEYRKEFAFYGREWYLEFCVI